VRLLAKQSRLDDEQLLRLYWNRASVKRELKQLQKERGDLIDKLRDQEATILRSKEQLDGLERLLTNPLAAANAMVYFQLRHLWRVAAQRLEQFAAELHAQRERRERKVLQGAALAKRGRRIEAIDEKLQGLLVKQRDLKQERELLQKQLDSMNPLLRIFRGPGMGRRLGGLESGHGILHERITELEHQREKIEGEPLPEPEGLNLESRRLINAALIALAQHLVVHFSEHDLASLARTATQRPVADMKFGDRRDCDRMVERIRERIEDLRQQKDLAAQVKRRADKLLGELRYQKDTDSTPAADSVSAIPLVMEPPSADTPPRRSSDAPLRINVLRDEYWDLYDVLR
jgi:hypothetical protein